MLVYAGIDQINQSMPTIEILPNQSINELAISYELAGKARPFRIMERMISEGDTKWEGVYPLTMSYNPAEKRLRPLRRVTSIIKNRSIILRYATKGGH